MDRIRTPLLIVGLIAYLVFLPATLPAVHFLGWSGLADRGMFLSGVGGTAWAGHADTLRYHRLALDKVRWRFRPLGLFAGRVEFGVKFFAADSRGIMEVGRSLFGDLLLRDTRAEVSALALNPLLPPGTVQLGGTFQVDLKRAVYREGPVGAEGKVVWKDAAIVDPVAVSLGSLELQLQNTDGGFNGKLTDIEGPIEVRGDVSLSAGNAYRIAGTIKPRESLPPEVRRVLPFLGLPDAQGRYRIELSGTL